LGEADVTGRHRGAFAMLLAVGVPATLPGPALAEADARIRTGGGGDRTVAAVFRRINADKGVVTRANLAWFTSEVAGKPRE
jgi:hypothetical protein